MNWRNPKKELPKSGEVVGVLYQHWKEHRYMSSQIMFGEVEYDQPGRGGRANSCDFTGGGNWSVYFDEATEVPGYGLIRHEDVALAWIPASEFPLPAWTPHDKHWDR